MKILFIAGSLNQGGAEYQILQLAKLFQENPGAWTQYKLENCSVSELKFSAVPELVVANQIAHLVSND